MTPAGAVSALVVNFNAGDHLARCVRALKDEGVEQIVVADNGSVDGSFEALVAAEPDVIAVRSGANLGMGAGNNRAAAQATGEFLLVLNPDVVVEPGLVKALVRRLEDDGRTGIAGPRIENGDGTLYPSARTFPSVVDAAGHALLGLVWPGNPFTRRYRLLDWDHATARDVDWVSGSCFLARRTAWDGLGGFDESFFMYMEDVDICWRMWRAGWRVVYEPAARAVHAHGASTDQTPYRMIVAHHRSMVKFAARTTRGWARALLPLMAAASVGRAVVACAHRWVAGRRPGASVDVQ